MGLSNEITPKESIVPVYLIPLTTAQRKEYAQEPEPSPEEKLQASVFLRQAGIDKLMALGLTEDEAKAIAGI